MNQQIHKFIIPCLEPMLHDSDNHQLRLHNLGIKNINFISKFLTNFSSLKKLDLSGNNLGDEGAAQIDKVLKLSSKITHLNVSNNGITPIGLQLIASSLADEDSTLEHLDIRDNLIPDHNLKILLACLYQNESLQKIEYTISEESNKVKF